MFKFYAKKWINYELNTISTIFKSLENSNPPR